MEALRALREKLVREHDSPDHKHDERAVALTANLASDASTLPEQSNAPISFAERSKLAQAAQQRSQKQVRIDEEIMANARVAESKAVEVREAAETRLKASRVMAASLALRKASRKKQKTAFGASVTV